MAGFRVEEHRRWRRAEARRPTPDSTPTRAARPRHVASRAPPSPHHSEKISQLDDRVRSLGPLAWPARAHDVLFGGWGRGATAFAVRFLLIVVATALLFGGALAESPIVYKTGDFRSVTPTTVVDTYVTENSVHLLPIEVAPTTGKTSVWFTEDKGRVDIPGLGENEEVHALKVRLVRKDPNLTPVLLVSAPGRSPHSLTPESDDGVSVNYAPIRLTDPGQWQLIVHTNKGLGQVEMHIGLARAPLTAVEVPDVGTVQTAAGGAVLAILLGAYTPGARLLRERRRLENAAEDDAWAQGSIESLPADATGFARMSPRRRGVLAWKGPGKDVPEQLAKAPGKGWIIRLD